MCSGLPTSDPIQRKTEILSMSDRLLVLVRHGQSEWNLKNLFTGWKDPDLTEQGIAEAKDARKKWGEEQVLVWRRSYDVPPPGGESLKDTLARTLPYYVQEILPGVLRGERTLVAAHGNSLRALIMVLEKLTPENILRRELATGVPIIYRLNEDATVASKLDLAA